MRRGVRGLQLSGHINGVKDQGSGLGFRTEHGLGFRTDQGLGLMSGGLHVLWEFPRL